MDSERVSGRVPLRMSIHRPTTFMPACRAVRANGLASPVTLVPREASVRQRTKVAPRPAPGTQQLFVPHATHRREHDAARSEASRSSPIEWGCSEWSDRPNTNTPLTLSYLGGHHGRDLPAPSPPDVRLSPEEEEEEEEEEKNGVSLAPVTRGRTRSGPLSSESMPFRRLDSSRDRLISQRPGSSGWALPDDAPTGAPQRRTPCLSQASPSASRLFHSSSTEVMLQRLWVASTSP